MLLKPTLRRIHDNFIFNWLCLAQYPTTMSYNIADNLRSFMLPQEPFLGVCSLEESVVEQDLGIADKTLHYTRKLYCYTRKLYCYARKLCCYARNLLSLVRRLPGYHLDLDRLLIP